MLPVLPQPAHATVVAPDRSANYRGFNDVAGEQWIARRHFDASRELPTSLPYAGMLPAAAVARKYRYRWQM